jgi:phytoene desaturase
VNGVWFPKGGMSRVVDALVEIAQSKGVHFMYNSPVEIIDVEDRRATGVTLFDGRKIAADLVVANADLPYVYQHLLPDDGSAARLEGKRYSCSAMMFCWGVNKQYPQLHPHHLFFAKNIREDYRVVTEKHSVSGDPSFYLHVPRSLDASLAPEGQDTLTVLVPVGHLDETDPKNWLTLKEQTRQAVLKRLADIGLDDLEKHIKFEMCFKPHEWQKRFNLAKGASHGLSHNLMQMAYFRPHNRHKRYRNLYFVGASTHPGTGVPVVLVSASLTTERILQEVPQFEPEAAMRPLIAAR